MKALSTPLTLRHPAHTSYFAMIPKRKFISTEGVAKQEPKTRLGTLSDKPAPEKWKQSQNKWQEGINLQTKKVETKWKGAPKGEQVEVANQEMKEDLHEENGETKNEESPASDEAGEKEA
ncbi:non-histone chromosomal protein, partial [Lynx pardinus]